MIYIECHGQGKPLVFFHGWGFDSRIWLPLLPELRTKYRVYLVDLPGFGRTKFLDWEVFKSELLQRLPEKFFLAGWSMGGLYATRLAMEAPNRVQHLLNIASTPNFIQSNNWPGIEPRVFKAFHINLLRDRAQTLKEFIQLQARDIEHSIWINNNTTSTDAGLQAGLNVLLHWNLLESVGTMKQPVCYLFGKMDAIVPYRTMQALQKRCPSFQYVLFHQSAHMPFISQKNDFLSLVKRLDQ